MSSKKKSTMASAVVELRSTFNENQQRFSDRLGLAIATVGRWEIGERHPSPRFLREMWRLAAEQNRADLAQVFADAFALRAGYQLSSGESGFLIRGLLSDIRAQASKLFFDDLTFEERKELGSNIWRMSDAARDALRDLDIEPPFRSLPIKRIERKK
jgi:transcriptional regulator with XRE-family HTH domain